MARIPAATPILWTREAAVVEIDPELFLRCYRFIRGGGDAHRSLRMHALALRLTGEDRRKLPAIIMRLLALFDEEGARLASKSALERLLTRIGWRQSEVDIGLLRAYARVRIAQDTLTVEVAHLTALDRLRAEELASTDYPLLVVTE